MCAKSHLGSHHVGSHGEPIIVGTLTIVWLCEPIGRDPITFSMFSRDIETCYVDLCALYCDALCCVVLQSFVLH